MRIRRTCRCPVAESSIVSTATTTSTEVQERPAPSDADTGENDELFHYVLKSRIVESAVTGSLVTALCGAVFPVTRVPKPNSPICPLCKELYDARP